MGSATPLTSTVSLWLLRIVAAIVALQCVQSTSSGCTGANQEPLRLVLNTTALVSNKDPRTCRTVGQVVPLTANCDTDCTTHTCAQEDIVDGLRFAACAQSAVVAVEKRLNESLCLARAANVNEFEIDGLLYMLEADHVVFIGARPLGALGSVVATQQSTRTDNNGRPTSSTIIFLPSIVHRALAASDGECYRVMYQLVLHFATHVLGFDVVHMSNWRLPGTDLRYADAPNNAYPNGPVLPYNEESKVVMRNRSETVFGLYTASLIGPSLRVMIVSPNALAAARSHFGCPTMRGLLVEELGPSELHWERRIMNFELMTSEFNIANHSAWSTITLGALVDTGFYSASTTAVTDDYQWGRNKGCAFVEASCSPETWGPAFCNGTFGVGYDRSYVAECGNADLPTNFTVPPYQHFYDPMLGGWDPYADFCPYAGNVSAERVVARCSDPRHSDAVDYVFSNISGARTMAVWTSILNQSNTIATRDPFLLVPRCMQFLCLNTSYIMYRAGDAWFPCAPYPTLSEITFPSSVTTGPLQVPFDAAEALPSFGFYGQLQCPNVTDVCPTGSAFYGASRFFSSTYYPKLVNITPTHGSVAGGTVLTVTATFARFRSGSIQITCQGLLIGGQPTNLSSFEYNYQESKGGVTLHYFTVNTSQVLTEGVLGGSNADGSGPVDVGLLCTVADAMECGPQYHGQCVVDVWQDAYTWDSLPAGAAELGFLGTVVGQAIMALLGISVMFVLLVGAAMLAGKKEKDSIDGAESGGEGGGVTSMEEALLVVDDDDDGDVELMPTDTQEEVKEEVAVDAAINNRNEATAKPSSASQHPVNVVAAGNDFEDPLAVDDDDDLLGTPPPPPPPPPTHHRSAARPPPPPPPPPPTTSVSATTKKKKKSKGRKASEVGNDVYSDDEEAPPPPPIDSDDAEIAL